MKLIQNVVEKLTPPAGKADHIEWDAALPGFGLRSRRRVEDLTWHSTRLARRPGV